MPKIGDIVLYTVAVHDPEELRHNQSVHEDLPAMVIRVWSDECVNLKVFTDGPTDVWKTSVLLGNQPGTWRELTNG